MISEAGFLGKKIYIYRNKSFCSKKHLDFHNRCFEYGIAKNLDLHKEFEINDMTNTKLDEAQRVAKMIIKKFKFN